MTIEATSPGLEVLAHLSLPQLCGQTMVVGFEGPLLPQALAADLSAGLRAGVILFKHNLPSLESTWNLTRQIQLVAGAKLPPLIALDQEGGRVTRLPKPIRSLPSMRSLGMLNNSQLVERAAEEVARGLLALGFNCNFAPVLDVDSNPANPIIGDRSFSDDPQRVAYLGLAFAKGLRRGGVLACGKHFPGHGDTARDSHLELPTVSRSIAELEQLELLPFREAVATSIDSLMTAHVIYECLDPAQPATLSRSVVTDLLRLGWGYDGLVFSDDLQMGAISQIHSTAAAAVCAIRAGCDSVLICNGLLDAERVLDALVAEAETDPAFCERVYEAAGRSLAARCRYAPQPATHLTEVEHLLLGSKTRQFFDELEACIKQ